MGQNFVSGPFSLEYGEGVQGFDDGATFFVFYGELDYALSDRVLGGLYAARQNSGVGFEYSGFVEWGPSVVCVHNSLLPGTGKVTNEG
jgi:hypothetical protein